MGADAFNVFNRVNYTAFIGNLRLPVLWQGSIGAAATPSAARIAPSSSDRSQTATHLILRFVLQKGLAMKLSVSTAMPLVFAILTGISVIECAAPQPRAGMAEKPKKLLFVCEHGSARSVLAASEFNEMAKQRGLADRAIFRGTNPDSEIAPAVIQALAREGVTVEGKPSAVTTQDMEDADTVVSFACKLPQARHKHPEILDWNDVPSPGANLEAARADIRRRVSQLLDRIQSNTLGSK
jgi:arsenate reductase